MILITGATSGLGLHTSLYLMDMGYQVVGVGRRMEALNQITKRYGKQFTPIQADLLKFENYDNYTAFIPQLTGIVFCAGVTGKAPARFIQTDKHLEIIDMNINSPLLLLSSILRKKKLLNGSSVVFIASSAGVNSGFNGLTSYAASKASIIGSVRCLAVELARKKIRVNAIAPAGLKIGMITDEKDKQVATQQLLAAEKKSYLLFNDFIDPDFVSGPIEFLLSKTSSAITGQIITVCGGNTL